MKKNKKGFTLIELLVVVLIIGVLAAVALPQYEMAVEKTRATQAIIAVKAWADALERYYMANGEYPPYTTDSLDEVQDVLDIEVPTPKGFAMYRYQQLYVAARRRGSSRFNYIISKTMHNTDASKRGLTCNTVVNNDTSRSAQLCKMICKTNTLTKVWGSDSSGCEFQ